MLKLRSWIGMVEASMTMGDGGCMVAHCLHSYVVDGTGLNKLIFFYTVKEIVHKFFCIVQRALTQGICLR